MKNKIMPIAILGILLIFLVACAQTITKEVAPTKETKAVPQTSPAAGTGDAAVDSVGKDLSSTDSVQNDLNSDNINDSGLSDIQNI